MVSIYIPAYNAAETIVAAIESALAQTYHDFEVVVCDDGSTDRTGELVRDTYRSDPRVRLVQQDNRGIGSASNMAIAAGKGPFLLHLDSDDLLEPEAIEVLLPELLEHSQRGCVYGRHYRFRDDLSDRRPSWFRPRFDRVELLHGMIVHPPRLFRKREWARLGGFSTTLSSAVDFDFFLRMSAIAELHHVDRLLYNYRIHARSTSMRYPEEQFGNARRAQAAFLSANGLSNWLPVPDEAYENPRAVTFARAVDRPSAAVAAEPSSLRPEDGAINVPNE